jgi:uracil-DNA glycosylase family 4
MAKRFSYVPPSGPPDAKIALVGEQPGKMEVARRKPFIGPAGQELSDCMASAQLARSECYFTNVIKDLDAPISHYINIAKGNVTVSPAGEQYIEELRTELEQLKPNVCVAVGNIALYALTSRRGITKWRGSVIESTLVPGLKVVPVIHPATIIPPKMVYLNKHLLIHDLTVVRTQSEFPEIVKNERTYLIGPSYYDSMGYLSLCFDHGIAGDIIYFDIEIHNMELSCISFSYRPDEAISIPFVNSTGDYFTIEQEADLMKAIAKVLENPSIKKCGQNVIFDSSFLFRRYGIATRNLHDTMIAQQIIAPDFPKGLDFITSMWTDMPYYKDEGKQWFKVGGRWNQLWEYNARDSIACAIAFPRQVEELREMKNLTTYDRQRSLIEPLTFMMEHGIKVDVEGMQKAYDQAGEEMAELQEELNHVAGQSLNPNSPKQLRDYFYITKGISPYRKGGRPTVDDNALKRLSRRGFAEARIIQDLRRLAKQRGNYLDTSHVDSDGRIRCSYNPVGTRYSRLSSSKSIFGTGMNMQNWPHSMLRYLVADEGYVYYSFDLSQFENRIVAYVGNVTQMIEAFETGVDVHSLTASLIFGKPIDEVSREDGSCPLGDGQHSERFWGKKANHGLNYDLGYKTFALYYELPENEAKAIIERYHMAYPGVRLNFHGYVRRQLAENRMLTNLMGRRTRFLGRWDDKLFKEAYSCIPQGTCGDVINERGINYIYYNQQLFDQVDLLTQVHDSVGFQIPLSVPWSEHARMLNLVKSSLETPLCWHDREFVIPADLSMGLNMGEVVELGHKKWPQTESELASWLAETYGQKLNKGG